VTEPVDKVIARIARRQRGYVTRRQLLALGLDRQTVDYRLKLGRLIPVYAGVYAVGHVPTLPGDRAKGALLACGRDAVLSHGSAASLWRIRKEWKMPFEVTAATARRRVGIRVHRCALTRRDVTIQLGLRVTSPARTLIDNAPRLREKQLARAVNDLRGAGYLRLLDLAELLERCPRHPGARRLKPFVLRPHGPTRSEFEDTFLEFARRFGLPRPKVNTRVNGAEVDAFFPNEGLIVELDGYDFHSSRASFESDHDRDADMLLAGLPTVRITWERLIGRPAPEADRLNRILAARRR
jgi:very-short-patch-repair endonuclease